MTRVAVNPLASFRWLQLHTASPTMHRAIVALPSISATWNRRMWPFSEPGKMRALTLILQHIRRHFDSSRVCGNERGLLEKSGSFLNAQGGRAMKRGREALVRFENEIANCLIYPTR